MARKKTVTPETGVTPKSQKGPALPGCCSFDRIVDWDGLASSWLKPNYSPQSCRGRTGRDLYGSIHAEMCDSHRAIAAERLAAHGIKL